MRDVGDAVSIGINILLLFTTGKFISSSLRFPIQSCSKFPYSVPAYDDRGRLDDIDSSGISVSALGL